MDNKIIKSVYMEKITIEKNEELGSILIKLENSKDKDVTFRISESSIILQSIINLKILKKRAEELGKRVSIERIIAKEIPVPQTPQETESKLQEKNAGSISKNVTANVTIKSHIRDEEGMVNSCNTGRVKMFDIVKKIDSAGNTEKMPVCEKSIEEKHTVSFKTYASAKRENDKFTSSHAYGMTDSVQKTANIEEHAEISKVAKKKIILPSIISKIFYIFVFIVVAVAAVSAAMALPKVNIDVRLKPQIMTYDLNLKVDDKAGNVDAEKFIIPAKREEVNAEASETFSTTAKKHIVQKATGKLTIYNEYSSSDQKIVASTRFLSKEGKLFRATNDVTIPGFTRVEGKDVPGEVTIDVVADKAGEDFNIGPASFTIPGFQGSLKYSTIYGRSSVAMTGGADREAMYFSESDYIAAKDRLVKLVIDKNNQELIGKETEMRKMLDGTKREDEIKVTTDVKVGDVAEKFKMVVSKKESILFVYKDNINEIVDWKISSEKNGNFEVIGLREYGNGPLKAVRKEDGTVELPVSITQSVVAKIDIDKLKRDLYNKNEDEARAYFSNVKEFKSVNVTFFWTKNVPESNDKIYINIEK